MSKPRKTVFNESWLLDPDFKNWLRESPGDPYSAMCVFCHTKFNLSNMGKRAVRSHVASRKHQSLVESRRKTSSLYVYVKQNLPSAIADTTCQSSSCQPVPGTSSEGSITQVYQNIILIHFMTEKPKLLCLININMWHLSYQSRNL